MMKKKIKFHGTIVVLLVTAVLFLFGCGADETVLTESPITTTDIDVQKLLEDAEEEAADLQKKLTEDSSLKQVDMNQLSYEIYMVWDNLLNELWDILQDSLDERTMNALLEEQRTWISTKESEIKKAGEAFSGGSMASLASNQKASELTKIRVYELAIYLGIE